MHDFYEAQKILEVVLEIAKEKKLKKISKIVLELGNVKAHGEDILPENLKFNVGLLAKGTKAEGAEIVIKKIGGKVWRLKEIEGEG